MFVWNVPNLLTMARILLACLFLWAALFHHWVTAFWIFVTAASTDMADGALARLLGQKTRTGAFLDPVADKVLMSVGFLLTGIRGYLPLWLVAIVLLRDLVISVGVFFFSRIRHLALVYRPLLVSKVATFSQMVSLFLALFHAAYLLPNPLKGVDQGATAFFTVLSGILYTRQGIALLRVSDAAD